MNELLALILVGLVVATAMVTIFVILTGPSETYSETDYPRSNAGNKAEPSRDTVRPDRRSENYQKSAVNPLCRQDKSSATTRTSGSKNRQGIPS